MMHPPVSASQGVMSSLPTMLLSLLESEHGRRLSKEVRTTIDLLRGDMEALNALPLLEPSEVEHPKSTAESWMKEVRELSYDVDDFVDEIATKTPSTPSSLPGKITRFPQEQIRRRRIINDISGFRARAKEAIKGYMNFRLGNCSIRPRYSPGEHEESPLKGDDASSTLVGIESYVETIGKWLAVRSENPSRMVILIVGPGGVGKTTLAKKLYNDFWDQFEHRAFVRTSKKPDRRTVLTSMMSQLQQYDPLDETCDEKILVDKIKIHLRGKRCLIVLDNIWTVSVWNVVRHALPEDCQSRIVVTTEIDDVTQACKVYEAEHNASHENRKYIFKMEPLSDSFSRDLLVSRVFGDKDKCPELFKEPSKEIARKCGGLPLAAIAAASLLLSRPDRLDEWNYAQNSLIPNLRTQPTSKGMTQLLNNSFNNLPHHLKACMLYLSIYKEDQIINLDDLLKQWIAENFISENDGESLEKVARSHFYELVHRGMIVPEHINYNDEVVSCTVHDMVLNFVRHKAMEENFVTAIDHSQTGIKLADKVRRLSLHMGYSEYATPPACIRMSQLRSLVFSGLCKFVPSIWKFHLLRVLFLDGKRGELFDLTRICELSLLRYLQIEGNVCIDLPSNLQGLKYLTTLHIGSLVTFLKSDIVHLPPLLHLRLPPSLQNFVEPGNVDSIDDLTHLQDLELICPQTATPDRMEHNMKLLVSILRIFKSLKSLTVLNAHLPEDVHIRKISNIAIFLDALDSVSSPPSLLQRLQLFPRVCVLPRLPKWIANLKTLCILKVSVMELLKEDIEILSKLSCLTVFSLYVRTTPAEPIIFGKSGFPDLKYFKFKCSTVSSLSFVEGAMPKLQRLKMEFNGSALERCNAANVCFKHCPGVKEVILKIWGAGTGVFDRMTVASDVTNAIRKNTGIPSVIVRFMDRALEDLTIDHTDHNKLALVDTMIPWPSPCNGCSELGAGRRYKCEQCNSKVYYDMCCATAPRTLQHPLFPGKIFQFLREPIASECGRACDACGDLLHGFVYHCNESDLDLHPRCARLPVRTANIKGYTMELCRVASSRCCICMCGKEGYRHNFWAYRFYHKGQAFYLHMACLKDWASRSHETLTRMYEILMGGPQRTPTEVSCEYTSDQVGSCEKDDDTLVRQEEITETFQQKEVHSIQQHDREEHTEKEADARSHMVTELPLHPPGQGGNLAMTMEEEPVAPPEMITHLSHQQHKLRLVTTTCDMPFRCDGCMEPGDGPRYRCDGCNFDMHTFCAKLPATLHHPMYAGRTFTFYAKPPAPSGRRICAACGDPVRGFVYHCSGANLNLHPCCASLQGPITLDGHAFDVRAPRKCSLCKKEKGPDRELWCYHTNIDGEGVYLHVACVKHLAGKRWQAGREKKHGGQIMLASEELMMEGPLKSISSEQDRIVVGGVVRIIISVIFGDPTANKGDNARVALSLQGLADLFSIQS